MKKIFVAGHRGMVGSAICRQLQKQSDVEIITRTRDELDLCDQSAVHEFMKSEKPDEVILAAAKVGAFTQIIPTLQSSFIRTSNPKQCHSRSAYERCAKTAVPWFVLHLPTCSRTADERRCPSDGCTRADQRTLCDCEDCRDKDVRKL